MKYRIQGTSFAYEIPVSKLQLAIQQAVFEISEETPANTINVVEIDAKGHEFIYQLEPLLLKYPNVDYLLGVRKALIEKQKAAERKANDLESRLVELERTLAKLEKSKT